MAADEHRRIARDSLFLTAGLRIAGDAAEHRVKVRNLSSGGMMAEGAVRAVCGVLVEVDIRNVGWVAGAIAWVQGNRFGIAFSKDIDAKLARVPVTSGDSTPRYAKPAVAAIDPAQSGQRLRKI